MNEKKLSDEIMYHLQMQKEYIGLDMEEKALRFISALALMVGLTLLCSLLLYHFMGYIATFIFLFLLLISIAISAYLQHRRLVVSKISKAEEIRLSQHRMHQQLTQSNPSPDFILELCQTIQNIRHIIREVKFLFKEKGD